MSEQVNRSVAIESLIEFPYLSNYLKLSFIEWELLELKGNEKIVFIGSGPFPLTAIALNLISRAAATGTIAAFRKICMSPELDGREFCRALEPLISQPVPANSTHAIDLIDVNQEATDYAAALIRVLHLDTDIRAVCCDGMDVQLENQGSVIYIASMVKRKEAIIKQIMRQAIYPIKFLVRGVEPGSLKELLYEPVSAQAIASITAEFPDFRELKTFFPDNKSGVINSVHIFGHNGYQ